MKAEAVVTTSLATAMLLTAAMSLHARLIPSPVQRGRARVGQLRRLSINATHE